MGLYVYRRHPASGRKLKLIGRWCDGKFVPTAAYDPEVDDIGEPDFPVTKKKGRRQGALEASKVSAPPEPEVLEEPEKEDPEGAQ